MSYGEREALTSLITMIIVVVMFYWVLTGNGAVDQFNGTDGLALWGWLVLKLIGVSLIITIGVFILSYFIFTAINKALTGEDKLSDLRDERDHLIEIRGMRFGSVATSIGLFAMILDLAFNNGTALRALNLVLLSCSLSEIVKNIYKIYRYRAGF